MYGRDMSGATNTAEQSNSVGTFFADGAGPGAAYSAGPSISQLQPASSITKKSASKRAYSPDIPVVFDNGVALSELASEFGQGPSKTTSSPSTRERTSYLAGAPNSLRTAMAGQLSSSLQQATLASTDMEGQQFQISTQYPKTHMNGNTVQQQSPGKTHQRSATTGSAAVFSAGSPYSSKEQQQQHRHQQQQAQYSQDFRIPSHSGSTTSGFSAGSTGSSYDSVISIDTAGVNAGPTGLGVVVEGASYTSPSPGQTSAYGIAPAYAQVAPSAATAAGAYYAQPYGYQPAAAASFTTAVQQPVYQGAVPVPQTYTTTQIGSLRRSIAGQSTGGSSYQSGASNSPVAGMQRRSQDFDGTFASPALAGTVSYVPVNEASLSTTGGAKYVPVPHAYATTQGQPAPAVMMPQGSTKMAYTASDASSVAQPYYAPPAQDYQSVVDQIMAQSRKGTDYGLKLGDFEMLDTLGR